MAILANSIISELILLAGILLLIFIIFKLGKFIIGLIINIILGFIAIFLLNAIFGLGIPWNLPVIVITALGGMVGVAIIVILDLIGIVL